MPLASSQLTNTWLRSNRKSSLPQAIHRSLGGAASHLGPRGPHVRSSSSRSCRAKSGDPAKKLWVLETYFQCMPPTHGKTGDGTMVSSFLRAIVVLYVRHDFLAHFGCHGAQVIRCIMIKGSIGGMSKGCPLGMTTIIPWHRFSLRRLS